MLNKSNKKIMIIRKINKIIRYLINKNLHKKKNSMKKMNNKIILTLKN